MTETMGKSVLEYFKSIAIVSYNGLFQKKKSKQGGLRKWIFQGYWRKNIWKLQGSIKKRSAISIGVQRKLMWNFHGFWFLTLEFPSQSHGVSHNFAEFSGVKACFLRNFLGESDKFKNSRIFFQKSIPSIPPHLPPVWTFSGIAQWERYLSRW